MSIGEGASFGTFEAAAQQATDEYGTVAQWRYEDEDGDLVTFSRLVRCDKTTNATYSCSIGSGEK